MEAALYYPRKHSTSPNLGKQGDLKEDFSRDVSPPLSVRIEKRARIESFVASGVRAAAFLPHVGSLHKPHVVI